MSETFSCHSYVQSIKTASEQLFTQLQKIWDEIGIKEHARENYCEQAQSHLMALMQEMLAEASDKKQDILNSITSLLEEVHSLSAELNKSPEISDFTNVPLNDVQSILKIQVDGLKQMKEERLQILEELQNKEQEICKALGAQPIVKKNGIPSYEELESFKLYLEKQELEKIRLEGTFKEMRHSIVSMMNELTFQPSSEFEIVVYSHEKDFVYTPHNMVKLRELRDQLKENLDIAKEKAASKREELISLWKYLDVPEESWQPFLKKHSGYGLPDLHALSEEIKLCKKKRFENIAKYVEKMREELKNLWDLCKFDEEKRKKFQPYYVQSFDESLLALHDIEVQKLRQYYKKNKNLYDLFDECENLWEKMKEMDQRANDPERLHNRGGQLLIEEKERKLIQKKFPKLEKEINALIQKYEAENGEPFRINGMTFGEYFHRSAEDYAEMKETLKKQRIAKTKDKSMKKTPTMSTSRRTPASTTSMLRVGYTSTKRRVEKSPLGNSAKRNRLSQSEKARPTLCTSKIRRSGRVPRRLLRAMNSSNRSPGKAGTSDETHTTIGSVAQYQDFQQHLEQREELRSSLLPEQILKTACGNKPKMRTPVKTPVKPLRKNISASTTPKMSHIRDRSRSPKLTSTPRLAAAPSKLPFLF